MRQGTYACHPENEQLRSLLFRAEEAERSGGATEAKSLHKQLDFYLDDQARKCKENGWYCTSLQSQCRKAYLRLSSADLRKSRTACADSVLSSEKGLEDFVFKQSPQDELQGDLQDNNLLGLLLSADLQDKLKDTFKDITCKLAPLSDGQSHSRKEHGSPLANPPGKRRRSFSPPKMEPQPGPSHAACRNENPDSFEAWARKAPAAGDRVPLARLQNGGNTQKAAEQSPVKAARQSDRRGFQTAKSVLAADLRKGGKGFNPREFSSGSMFPDADSAFSGQRGGHRPVASGLRKTQGPVPTGARGAFVPPFVAKAMSAQNGDKEEGPLSSKTLDLLAGPNGELPEILQKVDPNILELVCNEILDKQSGVKWEDIAGQHEAKSLVQELVVWPMLNPHLFTGARSPPKGLLLFGPPGTGKTLIGRAIASNIKATFFNISAGSLTSKWIGEGEKMVRALFAVAAALQPAVIFIDEIDSVLSARKAEGEHEASRRLKTELLVQMEGVDPSAQHCRILLVGATNRPEELDEAARRRMPKQLYIPLPCAEARASMLQRQLGSNRGVKADLPDADIAKIVSRTTGYSGSDMRNLIQEASQGPVRDAVKIHGAGVADLSEDDLRPVVIKDFQVAARAQRASVEPSEVVRYEQYDAKHGARYTDASVGAEMDVEEDW